MTPTIMEGYVGDPGARTWYQVIGDPVPGAAPVLLVHGGPGGPWPNHLDAVDLLARHRQVVLYHQLGCGRSDDPADPARWTVAAFVEELEALRRHLELDEVHVHGWSWGGLLAVAHALEHPTAVRSLVLNSPVVSAPFWVEETLRLRDALPPATVRALRRHEEHPKKKPETAGKPREGKTAKQLTRPVGVMRRLFPLMESAVGQRLAIAMSHVPPLRAASHQVLSLQYMRRHVIRSRPVPPALFTMLSGMNSRLYEAMWGPAEYLCTGTLGDVDLTDRLGEIAAPVLITSGRHDEATPAQMQAILDHVRDGRWVVFEESAHCAILEEADRYAATVDDFLSEVDTAR